MLEDLGNFDELSAVEYFIITQKKVKERLNEYFLPSKYYLVQSIPFWK